MPEKVGYNDPTPNNFPNDYDDSQVDGRVKIRSKSIANKEYGKHVREALMQGIEIASVVAGEAKNVANDTSSRQDAVNQSQKDFEDRYNDQVAGNTNIDEVIDARKPTNKPSYATLGERLNDMPSSEELELMTGDDGNDVDGGIPSYMNVTLNEALANIDTSKFNLGFGTDYHYDIWSNYDPQKGNYNDEQIATMWRAGLRKSLNLTSLSTKLDAIVFGGDNVDSPDAAVDSNGRKMMLKENKDFANTVFTSTKAQTFILKGNHDCNYYSGNTPETIVTDAELKSIYRQKDALFNENRIDNSNYFYKDFYDKKVRLIGLDMYDMPEVAGTDGKMKFNRFTTSGLQQAQLNWLANDALLTAPKGYTVLITAHCSPDGTLYTGAKNHNHTILKTILEAFVAGTTKTVVGTDADTPATIDCGFKESGHLAGFMFGHWHKDDYKTLNGVNYIGTRCSLTTGDEVDNANRMAQFGTANEDAFDIATINNADKTLTIKRIGAGSHTTGIATRSFTFK